MKIIDIDLNSIDYAKPFSHYASLWGVGESTVKRWFIKLGIHKNFYYTQGVNTGVLRKAFLKSAYDKNPKKCLRCHASLSYDCRNNSYCSRSCSQYHYAENNPEKIKIRGENTKRRIKDGTWKMPNPPRITGPRKPRLTLKCKHCSKTIQILPSCRNQQYCSKACSNHSPNLGGYREKAGAPFSGWYKQIYCNSSWELVWVVFNLENGINFTRNTLGFEYEFQGKRLKYYPDFKLSDGPFVEIKGRDSLKWQAKITQFKHPLKIYYRRDMNEMFKYVIGKYGQDFIKLYDGNPHNDRKNKCEVCGEPAKKKYCCQKCSGKAVSKLRGWAK